MMMRKRHVPLRNAARLWLGAVALCAFPLAHAQTYQVGQYLGNLNDAGRFAYNTMGGAAQHANYSPAATWAKTAGQNYARMAGTASATIGGRTVPLTLLSRVPLPAIATGLRAATLMNPATAAVTLVGFAAMNGWLSTSGLDWNPGYPHATEKPFLQPMSGWLYSTDSARPPVAHGGSAFEACMQWIGLLNAQGNQLTYLRSDDSSCVFQNHLGSVGAVSMSRVESSGPPREIDWDEGISKLTNPSADYSAVDWKAVTEGLLRAGGSVDPSQITSTVSGPASQPGERTVTTGKNAQGEPTTTTKQTTHNYTYNNSNNSSSVTHNTTTTTTTVNNITNVTENETTEQTENKPVEEPQPDLCEKNPDVLACKKVELDTPDGEIPRAERTISYQAENVLGQGTCPADVMIPGPGGQIALSYAPTCNALASYVRPAIIVMALFAAYLIILPGGWKS